MVCARSTCCAAPGALQRARCRQATRRILDPDVLLTSCRGAVCAQTDAPVMPAPRGSASHCRLRLCSQLCPVCLQGGPSYRALHVQVLAAKAQERPQCRQPHPLRGCLSTEGPQAPQKGGGRGRGRPGRPQPGRAQEARQPALAHRAGPVAPAHELPQQPERAARRGAVEPQALRGGVAGVACAARSCERVRPCLPCVSCNPSYGRDDRRAR